MMYVNSPCLSTHTLLSSLTLCSLFTHNLVDNSRSLNSSRARISYLAMTRLPCLACLEQLIIPILVKICSMMITIGSVLQWKWMVLVMTIESYTFRVSPFRNSIMIAEKTRESLGLMLSIADNFNIWCPVLQPARPAD